MNVGPLLKKHGVRALLWFGFWTVVSLFYATQTMAQASGGEGVTWTAALRTWMPQWYSWGLLGAVIIWLDRRLPVAPERLGLRLACHLPLSFVFTTAYLYLREVIGGAVTGEWGSVDLSLGVLQMGLRGGYHWNVLIYWMIFGVYSAYAYHQRFRDRELRNAELEKMLAQARLDHLQAQLHPHFLFNTLNAISAYVESDPRTARRMIEHLGDLLRLSLEHAGQQEIPLEEELAFLDHYLDIQRVRFEDRLHIDTRVEPETLRARVPTLLLQPLVENAIRHGISRRNAGGRIEIEAWRDNGLVRLRVSDNGPGLPPEWRLDRHQGRGLSNTLQRLRQLYGPEAIQFQIGNGSGRGVTVELAVPFREDAAEPRPA